MEHECQIIGLSAFGIQHVAVGKHHVANARLDVSTGSQHVVNDVTYVSKGYDIKNFNSIN